MQKRDIALGNATGIVSREEFMKDWLDNANKRENKIVGIYLGRRIMRLTLSASWSTSSLIVLLCF